MAKSKINTGLLVGIIAIVINIITASVYIYQTQIMQSQQHASVWPYLEWRSYYNDFDGFGLRIKNNGVGPALIKSSQLSVDGKNIEVLDSLFVAVLGTTQFPHITSNIDNRVIPAGESVMLVRTKNLEWGAKLYYKLQEHQFEMNICYESIYGDQWTCSGLEVEDGKCK